MTLNSQSESRPKLIQISNVLACDNFGRSLGELDTLGEEISDVNKDLGPKAKAKDTGHKVKAKAKALGYQGQGQGLGVSRPRPRPRTLVPRPRPRTWVPRPRPRPRT